MGGFLDAYVGVDTGIIHESPSNDTNVVITSLPLNVLILFSLIPFHYCLTVDTILPFSLDFDEIRPHIEFLSKMINGSSGTGGKIYPTAAGF